MHQNGNTTKSEEGLVYSKRKKMATRGISFRDGKSKFAFFSCTEIRSLVRFLPLSVLAVGETTIHHPSRLLLVHLNHIVLLHLERLRRLVVVDPSSVEEESKRGDGDPDSLRVGLLELAHLGGLLDAEVNLVGVLADHLQLDVFSVVAHSAKKETG